MIDIIINKKYTFGVFFNQYQLTYKPDEDI